MKIRSFRCTVVVVGAIALSIVLLCVFNSWPFQKEDVWPDPYPNLPIQLSDDALRLYREVRVLCWITTSATTSKKSLRAVHDTWAPRCNKAFFVSSFEIQLMDTVVLDVSDSEFDRWEKTRKAWLYVYRNYATRYDWFLKADDNTFVVTENLRFFLHSLDPHRTYMFGRRKRMPELKGSDATRHTKLREYISDNAGYVISRGALQRLGPTLADAKRANFCHQFHSQADVQMSICLERVNVVPEDSVDGGWDQFATYPSGKQLDYNQAPGRWEAVSFDKDSVYGPDCCSDLTISFDNIEPSEMYILFFSVYRWHAYGVAHPMLSLKGVDKADLSRTASKKAVKSASKTPVRAHEVVR